MLLQAPHALLCCAALSQPRSSPVCVASVATVPTAEVRAISHHRITLLRHTAVQTAVTSHPRCRNLQVAKLFGRFSEKTLYLEKEVGVCCHSACSDCEWRTPDGGYRFDILKATAPKWLPCYLSRDFGDERGCALAEL